MNIIKATVFDNTLKLCNAEATKSPYMIVGSARVGGRGLENTHTANVCSCVGVCWATTDEYY